MNYKGGKNGSGVYQKLICMMPPHKLYVEAFLGSGAILRRKRPADKSIAFETNRATIWEFKEHVPADLFKPAQHNATWTSPNADLPYCGETSLIWLHRENADSIALEVFNVDAVDYLQSKFLPSSYVWGMNEPADVLIYADPPYPDSVRSSPGKIYEDELLSDQEHAELCDLFLSLPCKMMVSSYENDLYNRKLKHWRKEQYATTNRAGTRVIETVYLNFPEPAELHDYSHVGDDRRERWRIEKRLRNWTGQLQAMRPAERGAMLSRLTEAMDAFYAEARAVEQQEAEALVRRAKAAEKKRRPIAPKTASRPEQMELTK
jgi:DNA adenine methylase